jgi:NAD(P)-dependent dehydrogenase (short-subunit alcohol dehydrogenase family)
MGLEHPLEGKVGVITGASSGIGKAAALRWAELGADIVASARSDAPRADGYPSLVDTREGVEALGRRCVAVKTDVSNAADVERLYQATIEAFGRVDILMNNAAALEQDAMNAPFRDMTLESWRYQIDVNLTGPWLVTKTFLPTLMANGGLVINVTSGPLPDQPPYMRLPGQGYPGAAYPTSKAGLNRMTEVLANELREYGIAVIAFHPGRARVERSIARLTAAGYDANQWLGVEHAIAKLEWLVTHPDPMSLTGTVQYTPQPSPEPS